MNVGVSAIGFAVAIEHAITKIVCVGRDLDVIALVGESFQSIEKRLKDRKISRSPNVAAVGGEVENNQRYFSFASLFQAHAD